MALPPAPVLAGERSPIFEALESDWFRSEQAAQMQQAPVEDNPRAIPGRTADGNSGRPAPSRPQAGTAGRQTPYPQPQAQPERTRGQQPHTSAPHTAPLWPGDRHQPSQPPLRDTPAWRSTPNDEVWQRAEQVREPSAGGITQSGLPRRVPRANLVPGGATQQAAQGGPRVSRAPDDVRGRLTNLRRGIQQGRQASDTTHQQEQ
jgi:hypothetical protein